MNGMDLLMEIVESVHGLGDRLAEIAVQIDSDAPSRNDLLYYFDEACRRLAEGAGSPPEPPDSWERIEEDAAKSVCGYFDREGVSCRADPECPALNSDSCSKLKAKDLVRRCKALAEVE